MQKIISLLIAFAFLFSLFPSQGQAYWVWSSEEQKFIQPDKQVEKSADELYREALQIRQEEPDRSLELSYALIRQYPKSVYAPEAQFMIATIQEEKGKTVRAAEELQKLIRDFPQSERINEATERLFKLANLLLTEKKRKVMGLALIPVQSKAIEIFKFISEQSPYGPYGERAQFQLGIAYKQTGKLQEAIDAFRAFIEDYPTSDLTDDAQYQLAETSYQLTQIAGRDQKAVNDARDFLDRFLQGYGQSNLSEKAESLKYELDVRDAEKNYRIGLYYEKNGFMDSALIYYEDVISRFSHTPFAEKAAERVEILTKPEAKVAEDRESIERRLAEINALLSVTTSNLSGKQEEELKNTKKSLERERVELEKALEKFIQEKYEDFEARRKSLREREKNLEEKMKTFKLRKKRLLENPSPELKHVLDSWSDSLQKEEKELAEERQRLYELGQRLEVRRSKWLRWIPEIRWFGGPDVEDVIQYKTKLWNKTVEKKESIIQTRELNETRLKDLQSNIEQLEEQEFSEFRDELLKVMPEDLNEKLQIVRHNRSLWEQAVQLSNNLKDQFESEFKGESLELVIDESSKVSTDVMPVSDDKEELENLLKDIQSKKADFGLQWLEQRKLVDSIASSFEQGRAQEKTKAVEPIQPLRFDDEVAKKKVKVVLPDAEKQMLRKQMKFLEREIRKRYDEIYDWNQINDENMEKMEKLLHSEGESGSFLKVLISPITGFFKLSKIFLLGLPNRERELTEEARTALSAGALSKEQLAELRSLKEEIELQSILIQGRLEEIKKMEAKLGDLVEKTENVEGFDFQSALLERYPNVVDYTMAAARSVLPAADPYAVLFDRLDEETQKLVRIESQMRTADLMLIQIGRKLSALESKPKEDLIEQTIGVDVDKTAVEPVSGEGTDVAHPYQEERAEALKAREERRNQLEIEIEKQLTKEASLEKDYKKSLSAFEADLFQWYQSVVEHGERHLLQINSPYAEQLAPLFSDKNIVLKEIHRLFELQLEQVNRQIDLMNAKTSVLSDRLKKYQGKSVVLAEALEHEIDLSGNLMRNLLQEQSVIEIALKN